MASIIDPATRIGLVTLSVGDLARALRYYQHNIGLTVLAQADSTATLGVGTTPLLHLREVPGARLVRRATGLYHFALRVPSRRDLARVIRHLIETATPVGGASDHLVSEALYLSDPDGHGIEIYRDRPRSAWYDAIGNFRMDTSRLDIDSILAELDADTPAWEGMPTGTDMGHIHLQVADVVAAEHFYVGVLGMERMTGMPSASFVSAGGYHHHIGLNSWAGVGVPAPPEGAARLLSYELLVPTTEALNAVLDRVRAAGLPLTEQADVWAVRDPSHNLVLLRAEVA
ncbi:MAG TPA: VOC family protein [Herpetosiphonaceae bacterium]